MHTKLGGHIRAVRSRIIFLDDVELPQHRDGYVLLPLHCNSRLVATAVFREERFMTALEKVMVAVGEAEYLQ